ncbi:hypothetical protein Tco_0013068 [Tanacetum coccineum]
MVRPMMRHKQLFQSPFWDYALETAVTFLNMFQLRGLSTRTRRPIDHMCLYIDAEEHELGDLGEPVNYKAALLDPNQRRLGISLNFLPNGKAVDSMWLFKKKTGHSYGSVHTIKDRLVAKGYTQNPRD